MIWNSLRKHCLKPIAVLVALLLVRPWLVLIPTPEKYRTFGQYLFSLALIGLIAWLIIRSVDVLRDVLMAKYDISKKDNLLARQIHTQIDILEQIVTVAVIVLALGTALMLLPGAKAIGKTILASAGVIGIVAGFAAQKTIATFFAGLQIAITQPIRLDDVVIVENEWGRIEEITLTYVVVRIWDQRRLIVPVTHFIEKPFQNWTRTTAELLGTVYIYTDHTVPMDSVRTELKRILGASPHWDKRVCVLQVTNTTERVIELRALMSAADASTAWDLRCEVREKLVSFLQQQYPEALPRIRAEMNPLDKVAS
ncbi:mechanosensitive ion channel family protein [Planctomycetota bacterium]